jgi:hypothetical protein
VKSLLLSPLSTFSPKVPGNGQDIKKVLAFPSPKVKSKALTPDPRW